MSEIKFSFDPKVAEGINKIIAEKGLTQVEMAEKVNIGETSLGKYLAVLRHAPPPSNAAFTQSACRNWLRAQEEMEAEKDALFSCYTADAVAALLRTNRRIKQANVIYGANGLGKTSGAMLFARDTPNTLYFRAAEWCRSRTAIAALLFTSATDAMRAAGHKWPGNVARLPWMVERFKGSGWQIIIDDAELLSESGVAFLLQFHDTTGTPTVLLGDLAVLNVVRNNPKLATRIGARWEVRLPENADARKEHLYSMADRMIGKHLPGCEDFREQHKEIKSIAAGVLAKEGHGHARTLRLQLQAAHDWFETANRNRKGSCTYLDAFTEAGGQVGKQAERRAGAR